MNQICLIFFNGVETTNNKESLCFKKKIILPTTISRVIFNTPWNQQRVSTWKLMIHWLEGYNFLEGIYQSLYMNVTCNYCWWKKSCTSWYGKYPIIYKVLYMPGGAGFLPSTVSQMYWEFSCSATLCCQEAAYQAETSEWAGNTTLAFSTVAAPSWSVGTLPKKNTPRNKHREEPIPKKCQKNDVMCVSPCFWVLPNIGGRGVVTGKCPAESACSNQK